MDLSANPTRQPTHHPTHDPTRHPSHRLSALAVTATLIAATITGTATAHATAVPTWTQATVPVPTGNILALTHVDRHTVWAAGFAATFNGRAETLNPLLLAGDDRGGAWHRIATPADTADSRINAISARTASDVWLVGDNSSSAAEGQPVLTEHWDGGSWQISYAPVPANAQTAGFLGVTSRSSHDAWAVGWVTLVDSETVDPTTGMTQVVTHDEGLLEHWDGTAWHQVTPPRNATDIILNAITTTSAGDLWATGETTSRDDTIADQPVALHDDGHGWRSVPLPKTGRYGELNAVVATGPDDVWAAGRTVLTDADHGHPLVEHWDGRNWKPVAAPGTGELHGATLVPGGLAVVGYDGSTGAVYGQRLTGGRWTSLGLPQVGDFDGPLAVTGTTTTADLVVSGAYDVVDEPGPIPLLLSSGQ